MKFEEIGQMIDEAEEDEKTKPKVLKIPVENKTKTKSKTSSIERILNNPTVHW